MTVVFFNPAGGKPDDFAVFGLHPVQGLLFFLVGDFDRFRGKVVSVKLFGIAKKSFIALHGNVVDDPGDRGDDFRGKRTAPLAYPLKKLTKFRCVCADDFHIIVSPF